MRLANRVLAALLSLALIAAGVLLITEVSAELWSGGTKTRELKPCCGELAASECLRLLHERSESEP